MPRKKQFNEPSVPITIRVPESKADEYRLAIKKYVQYKYEKDSQEQK